MTEHEIPETLWRAYEETIFEVDGTGQRPGFEIRIGHCPNELDELLTRHACQTWAFITAWNPASVPQPRAVNEARNRALREELEAAGHALFPGRGIGRDAAWEPEASFLVLDLGPDEALQLGRRFGQYATVVGRLGEAASLQACCPGSKPTDQSD